MFSKLSTEANLRLGPGEPEAALEIVDRVYVLNRGQLVLAAPAAVPRADPERLRSSYLQAIRVGGGDHG